MFVIDGDLVAGLPAAHRAPDGQMRTGLSAMTDDELAGIGIYPATVVKPAVSGTQYYGAPTVEISDGRATVTYPVLDYSAAEIAGMLEKAKSEKKQEIAAARYAAEIAGVTVGGFTVRTDRESQALITGAALKATQDATYTCRWKTESGFVTLDAATIIAVADAVRSHVQGCFDTEYAKCVLIDAAETVEDVEAIVW